MAEDANEADLGHQHFDDSVIQDLRASLRKDAKSASTRPTDTTEREAGAYLGPSAIWAIRCNILLTVGVIGLFLLALSFSSDTEARTRNILLGVGVELLASAGIVFGIVKCLNTKHENFLIRSLLFGGALVSLFPFLKTDCWCGEIIASAGIEILGAGIMLGLYDFLSHKFSANGP